jgi:hypothetical protein
MELAARERRPTLMKRKPHTPEEIIQKLREAGGQMASGKIVEDVVLGFGTS